MEVWKRLRLLTYIFYFIWSLRVKHTVAQCRSENENNRKFDDLTVRAGTNTRLHVNVKISKKNNVSYTGRRYFPDTKVRKPIKTTLTLRRKTLWQMGGEEKGRIRSRPTRDLRLFIFFLILFSPYNSDLPTVGGLSCGRYGETANRRRNVIVGSIDRSPLTV